MLLGYNIILAVFCYIGIRSYQHIAVHCRSCMGGEAALIIRSRVNRDGKELSGLFIQHIVLTLKALYRVVRVAEHLGNLRCIHTGTVDDPFCLKGILLRLYYPDILRLVPGNAGHLLSKVESDAILAGILCKTDGVLHRIQNAGGGHIHGKLTACIRVNAVDLIFVDHAHALDTVLLANGLVF